MRIYRKYIERITIIYPRNERPKAFQYCMDNDYSITLSSLKPVGNYRYDKSKGKIVAEREVIRDECFGLKSG